MSIVWVQLYYNGKDEPEGRPTSVKKPKDVEESEWNVDALAEAAKAKLSPDIDHAPPSRIFVYPPGTKPPFSGDKALKAWDPIPSNSSGPQPLIVVAPQQSGKSLVCSLFFYC